MPWPRPNGHRPSRCRWERHEPKCVRSSLARARAASSTHSGNSIPAIEAPTLSGGPARAGAMLAGSIWLNDFRQRNHHNGHVLELSDALLETVSDSRCPRNRTGHPPNHRRRRAAAGISTHCIAARQRRRAPLSAGSRCARHPHRHHREPDLPCAQSDSDGVRRIRRITNGDWTSHRRAALTSTRDARRRAPADANRPRHDRPRGGPHGNKRSPSRVQCWQSRPLPRTWPNADRLYRCP
ncbi:hypothetical protein BLA15945_02412 [Burkholderia lata]|uniref:Uncharacterized protein n=1 Tax=Burkholderia lata (strain ATCC 17760 / DSM 23089 / LMG 22485 / NCIMB 9086 / R18194 / 383) TaxID=482957 RepID=A0A6P2K951_BURL3|nr:hypothetical protein BLA15945_02412 [Burkholderia lata]